MLSDGLESVCSSQQHPNLETICHLGCCRPELKFSKAHQSWSKVGQNYIQNFMLDIGKSLSESLIFAEHGKNMLCKKIVLNVRNNFCTQHVLPRFELGIFMY